MRKKELIHEVRSFHKYLKERKHECEENYRKSLADEDNIELNVTTIILDLFELDFRKVLKNRI